MSNIENKIVSFEASQNLIDSLKNPSHKVLVLLMLDAGLRVSEALSLKWSNFDFKKKTFFVESLKKRANKKNRELPITNRLLLAISELYQKKDSPSPDIWLFESPTKKGSPIDRRAVNKFLARFSQENPQFEAIHPHKLRHTAATLLASKGADLVQIQNFLGHENPSMTTIYTHTPPEQLRQKLEVRTKKNVWQRLKSLFHRQKPMPLPKFVGLKKNVVIGRAEEIKKLNEAVGKKISVIITGETGIGKNALLDCLDHKTKMLVFDDTKNWKAQIVNTMLFLLENDKEAMKELLFGDLNLQQIKNKISKDSLINLCLELSKITEFKEYIIKINDIDLITPTVVKSLEVLKEHFIIITATREINIKNTSFLWDFDRIELKNLSKPDTLKLFWHHAKGLELKNISVQVWNATQGNPRKITDLAERLHKENELSEEIVENIFTEYLGNKIKTFDMSIFFFLFFGSLVVFRYLSSEMDNPTLKIIGSFGMIFLLFGRFIFNFANAKKI